MDVRAQNFCQTFFRTSQNLHRPRVFALRRNRLIEQLWRRGLLRCSSTEVARPISKAYFFCLSFIIELNRSRQNLKPRASLPRLQVLLQIDSNFQFSFLHNLRHHLHHNNQNDTKWQGLKHVSLCNAHECYGCQCLTICFEFLSFYSRNSYLDQILILRPWNAKTTIWTIRVHFVFYCKRKVRSIASMRQQSTKLGLKWLFGGSLCDCLKGLCDTSPWIRTTTTLCCSIFKSMILAIDTVK